MYVRSRGPAECTEIWHVPLEHKRRLSFVHLVLHLTFSARKNSCTFCETLVEYEILKKTKGFDVVGGSTCPKCSLHAGIDRFGRKFSPFSIQK